MSKKFSKNQYKQIKKQYKKIDKIKDKKLKNTVIAVIIIVLIFNFIYTRFNQENEAVSLGGNFQSEAGILEVHYIDVGQGDATLLRLDDFTMLIDTGDTFADEALMTYLDNVKVDEIDIFIGTHPHSDHIANASDIYDKYQVNKTIIPNAVHTSNTFENMITSIENEGTEVVEAFAGYTESIGDLTIEILSPLERSYDDLNDYSVVTKVTYKDSSFIFSGDATKYVEKAIVEEYSSSDLNVDVINAGHHGSDTSSCEEYLYATSPSIVVISCGKDNDYGHPHEEVLDRLEQTNGKILRTDLTGDIVITTDGLEYSIYE
ncbi:MAG: ComEC/Rec2 family competence protein [Lachnospirales bacterium]